MKVDGSTALVIGGAQGMGRCYCEKLLQHGAKVLLCDLQREAGLATASELQTLHGSSRVHFRRCDGTSREDVDAAFVACKKLFGSPDIVINHVGILDEGQWSRMLQINVGSTVTSTQAAIRHIGKENGGRGGAMVHTASIAGVFPRSPYAPVYAASKAAVVQYVRVMNHKMQYSRHGIRMMCVCPTIVETDMVDGTLVEGRIHFLQEYKAIVSKLRQGAGLIKPEWVADVLLQLLEQDEEMRGVAAVMEGRTPKYMFQGE